MASFKISGSISTLPLSLILGIISIQIIFQLSSDQRQSLDIESETISAYFDPNNRSSLKPSSSKSIATYNQSTMSHTATLKGMNGNADPNAVGGPQIDNESRIAYLEDTVETLMHLAESNRNAGVKVPKARGDARGEVQGEVRNVSDGQKSNSSDDSLTGGDGAHYFPVRVCVARREAGEPIVPGPSEIFMITSDSKTSDGKPSQGGTRRNLIHKIQAQFRDLELRDSISRRNIPNHCFWGDGYEVESIRINWDPKTPISYENTWGSGVGRNETEITDFNAKACLTGLEKSPISGYSLNVLIAPDSAKKAQKEWVADATRE